MNKMKAGDSVKNNADAIIFQTAICAEAQIALPMEDTL